MRAYVVHGGPPHGGAVLVIAPTAQRAKALAWKSLARKFVDDYTGLRCQWLRNACTGFLAKQYGLPLDRDVDLTQEAVIDEPDPCRRCELWNVSWMEDGLCDDCLRAEADERDDLRDELLVGLEHLLVARAKEWHGSPFSFGPGWKLSQSLSQ